MDIFIYQESPWYRGCRGSTGGCRGSTGGTLGLNWGEDYWDFFFTVYTPFIGYGEAPLEGL